MCGKRAEVVIAKEPREAVGLRHHDTDVWTLEEYVPMCRLHGEMVYDAVRRVGGSVVA